MSWKETVKQPSYTENQDDEQNNVTSDRKANTVQSTASKTRNF